MFRACLQNNRRLFKNDSVSLSNLTVRPGRGVSLNDKLNVAPKNEIETLVIVSRGEALKAFNVRRNSPREIRVRRMSLVRNHYLGERSEGCMLSKAQGENFFENIPNAFRMLKE